MLIMEEKIYKNSSNELENKLVTIYNQVVDTLIRFAIDYKENTRLLDRYIEAAEEQYSSDFHSSVVHFLEDHACITPEQGLLIQALREKIAALSADRWDDFSIKYADEWIQIRKQAEKILFLMKVKKRKIDKQFELPASLRAE